MALAAAGSAAWHYLNCHERGGPCQPTRQMTGRLGRSGRGHHGPDHVCARRCLGPRRQRVALAARSVGAVLGL